MDKDKVDGDGREKAKPSTRGNGNRYKDKFHSLKSRYDTVTSRREEFRRELEVANIQLRKLQAENDLLIDAMSIALPGQPTLIRHLTDPTPNLGPKELPRESNGRIVVSSRQHDHINGESSMRQPSFDDNSIRDSYVSPQLNGSA